MLNDFFFFFCDWLALNDQSVRTDQLPYAC